MSVKSNGEESLMISSEGMVYLLNQKEMSSFIILMTIKVIVLIILLVQIK